MGGFLWLAAQARLGPSHRAVLTFALAVCLENDPIVPVRRIDRGDSLAGGCDFRVTDGVLVSRNLWCFNSVALTLSDFDSFHVYPFFFFHSVFP